MSIQHGPKRIRDWALSNGRELAEAYSSTFERPDADALAGLRPGQIVKLIFEFEQQAGDTAAAERMWVIVQEALGEGRFIGRLDSDPFMFENLAAGDVIHFHRDNVIAVDSGLS